MDCCGNEEQTASTFGAIFAKCQSWFNNFLEGDIFSSENDKEGNLIVSVLFIFHVTFVFFFLAHHCVPRGAVQIRATFD